MSMTAVPISIRLVRAPTAASSGNGDPSCLAKWCTRKYAPSAPNSSAATAKSIDCSSASDPDRVCEPGDDDQCPNDKKPIFFTRASTRTAQAAFLSGYAASSHAAGSPAARDGRRAGTNGRCRRDHSICEVEEGRGRPRLCRGLQLPLYPLRGEPGQGGVGEAAEASGHPTPRQRHPP